MPEEKARYIDGVGWRCDTDTTRHHRENQWDYPQKQHIQCSRSITADQLEQQYKEWSNNAQLGVVSITSAISDGEKSVSKRLRLIRWES